VDGPAMLAELERRPPKWRRALAGILSTSDAERAAIIGDLCRRGEPLAEFLIHLEAAPRAGAGSHWTFEIPLRNPPNWGRRYSAIPIAWVAWDSGVI